MKIFLKYNIRILITLILSIMFFGTLIVYKMDYFKYLPAIDSSVSTTDTQTNQSTIEGLTQSFRSPIPTPTVTPTTPINWEKVNIDKVEVYKSERRMDLIEDNKIIRSYPVRLGFTPKGHKTTEGDGKTPEGKYTLDWRNPQSQFYKSLHISYPNKQDINQAKQRGVSAGGDIMIHGTAKKTGGSQGQPFYDYLPRADWTLGCVSISNKNMDEVWENVKNHTPIEIFP